MCKLFFYYPNVTPQCYSFASVIPCVWMHCSIIKLGYPHHVFKSVLSRAQYTFYTEEVYSLHCPTHPLNCKLTIHQVNTLCYNLVHTCSPSTLKVGTCSIPWALCDKQYFGESDTKFTSYIISNPENIVISEKQAIRWLVIYLYFFLPLMSTSADWWNESAAQFQP